MVALKDLVARGWKSDNGFRGNCLNKVEEWMKKEFSRTDLKANPHIQSKITAVKKNYNSLSKILDRSGVGFNVHGDFKIDCDDDQWDQIVKQDSHARGMRTRSWPYWEDWKVIFGKDRANGGHAEWVADAAANSSPDAPVTEIGESSDYHPSFEDFLGYDEQMQATFATAGVELLAQNRFEIMGMGNWDKKKRVLRHAVQCRLINSRKNHDSNPSIIT